MPKFWKLFTDDGAQSKGERTYTKHDTDYWDNRPSLASLIQAHAEQGIDYGALRDLAIEAGYSPNSFRQTMSNLYGDGTIEKRGGFVHTSDADDVGDWDLT